MRYILFILILICSSRIANGQTVNQPGTSDFQLSGHQLPDSILYLMGTDTLDGSAKQGLGKWHRADSLLSALGGDTDWYKLGTTTIPTNSDSAYRSGYLLLTGLDGGINTKIEMLKEGIIRFDKTGLYNTPTYLFSVNPFQSGANVGRMGMVAYASDNAYGGKKNQVFAFGINPIDADDSATGLYFSFEDYYRPSAPSAYSELHLLFNDSTDVDRRLWTWFINKSDPTAYQVAYYTDQFSIRDPRALTGDSTFFKIEQIDGVQTQSILLGANYSVSGGSKGVGQLVHATNNTFEIYPYGSMPSSSEFYTRQFNVTNVNRLRIENDFGTTNGSSGEATTIIGREGSYGGVVGVDSGWGWDLISGALVIDSSQVATQYDLTTITDTDDQGLTLTGTGPYTIDIDNGSDIIVDDLFGIILSEPTANTLGIKADTSVLATPYDLTQIPISSLKAAIATNTKDHGNYAQEWQWNTLNTSGLKLSSNTTAATSTNHKLFELSTTGGNSSSGASTYAAYFSNTHSGTTSTNYGLYSVATGAASANYGVYGTSNSSGVSGNVGAGISGRNSNGGIGVEGITTSGGIGIYAESPDGYGSYSYTTNGTAGAMRNNWPGNTDYGGILELYRTTSNGANGAAGIGGGITFYTEASTGIAQVSNQIKSIWTTATNTSRVSDFIVTGVNAATEADLLTIKGSGQMQFNKYTTGAFTSGTPVADLFVTSTGLVIAGNMNGQSWTADADDATTPTLISNQTLKIAGGSGITTDLFDNATTDSITVAVAGSKFSTITTTESSDYFLMHDANGAGTSDDVNEKITYANLITDIISDVGGSDGNGIYSGDGTTPSDVDVTITDNIDFGAGNLYIDETTDRVGIGTNSPTADFHIKGASGSFRAEPAAAGSAGSFIVGGTTDSGLESALILNYTDADYASGLEQTGASWSIYKDADVTQATSMRIVMPDNTDATIMLGEKSAALSDLTTESHIALNGGMAFTQNYEWTGTGADLTLDRSFNIVNVSGSGALGDEINLPEVNSTSDNWDSALTSAQVQVGQEYTISNFRSSTNLVLRVFTGDEINAAGNTTVTLLPATSVIVKCVRFSAGVGYWKTY